MIRHYHWEKKLELYEMITDNRDLSEFSTPITNLFASGPRPAISEEQAEFFEENGYLAPVPLLDESQVATLRNHLEQLIRPQQADNRLFYEFHLNESTGNGVLFHALGAWRISEAFHDVVFHPGIRSIGERLLGGRIRLWHDQLFVKPPRDGAIVAWHQDYSYWTRTVPMAHLTCWIALDDSTVENGCIHYVPGSHRWDLLPRTHLADDMEAMLDALAEEQRSQFRSVPIELKAGQATFHHPLMLHGSYENQSHRPRRGTVINLIRDGVTSDSDRPLLDGVPVIRKGEKIAGRFFPLL